MGRRGWCTVRLVLLGVLTSGYLGVEAAPPAARPAPVDTQAAEVFLTVRGNSRVQAVALMPFGLDPSATGRAAEGDALFRVVYKDLANAVRFQVAVDSLGVDSTGWGGALDRWTRAGASALLRGSVLGYPDHMEVFATLYRLPDRHMLIAKSYLVPQGQTQAAMHRLSDEIVFALTGQMGIATSRLAYIDNWGGHREVYVAGWDGQGARALTVDRALALSPAWAPDGRRMAYSSLQRQRWELFMIDLISGERRAVPTPSSMSTAPCWSPDGQRLLFAMADPGGNTDLYTIQLANGHVQRITDDPNADTEADWSPDGSRIAFVSDRTGLPQVYTADATGANAARLTWEPDAYEGSPAWSPDGRRIAFVRRGVEGFDVYVMELGGQPVRLTSGGSNENPSWSPDGLQLAYCHSANSRDDIYIMNYDGTNVRQLTTDGTSIMPAWSPRLDMDTLVQYGSR